MILTKKIDAKTIERLNCGDERALATVYDCFAGRLLRHAALRAPDEETAKDLVHSIFLKLWEHIRGGGKISHPQAFLYKSLHNALIDQYRIKNRETELPEDDAVSTPFSPDEITIEVDRALDSKEIRNALQKIRPEYKAVLVMRYMDELNMDEISEALDKSKNALYVLIHRATKDLARALVKSNNGEISKK
ncbi:RNA polymerase sigma factor [Candidatus Uhrbacteria bacterium]|nr:RNA polymerase sigma factor [Candidatus Uhrbacteria bacterium]